MRLNSGRPAKSLLGKGMMLSQAIEALELRLMLVVIVGLISISDVHASGGTGEYELDWPVRGEALYYHSCGCADSCWVAEVRSRRSGEIKARLRCDCEKLHFSRPGREAERKISDSCSGINDHESKAEAIRHKLEALLQRDKLKFHQ